MRILYWTLHKVFFCHFRQYIQQESCLFFIYFIHHVNSLGNTKLYFDTNTPLFVILRLPEPRFILFDLYI